MPTMDYPRATTFSAAMLFLLQFSTAGGATSALEMDCGTIMYRFAGSFLGKNEVFSLATQDIEWQRYCVIGSGAARSRKIEFPIVECIYIDEYHFKITNSGELEWMEEGAGNQWEALLGPWNNYNDSTRKIISDASETLQRLRTIDSEVTEWTTRYILIQRLNFELKRQQIEKITSTIVENDERNETADVNTFECK